MKINNNIKFKLICIFFTITVCASCWDKKSHREMQAEVEIAGFVNAIKVYKMDNSNFPRYIESEYDDYKVENEYLCDLLVREGGTGIHSPYLVSKCPLIDPWGKPYQFAFDGNNDNKVIINNKIISKTPIAIWSYGKNGIDENGCGDDIINNECNYSVK